MDIAILTPEYTAAIDLAKATVQAGGWDNTQLLVNSILLIENHEILNRLVNVQSAIIENIEALSAATEPAAPLIPKGEFVDRFVEAFSRSYREGGHTGLPEGESAAQWALKAGETYYLDVTRRARGPEYCADYELTLLPK